VRGVKVKVEVEVEVEVEVRTNSSLPPNHTPPKLRKGGVVCVVDKLVRESVLDVIPTLNLHRCDAGAECE
jgi:hypothetical protein